MMFDIKPLAMLNDDYVYPLRGPNGEPLNRYIVYLGCKMNLIKAFEFGPDEYPLREQLEQRVKEETEKFRETLERLYGELVRDLDGGDLGRAK